MGLFGPSKKDKQIAQLKQEIIQLQAMLAPEQQEILLLKQHISSLNEEHDTLQAIVTDTKQSITIQSAELKKLEEQISKNKQQLSALDEGIDMLNYGLYKPMYEFASSDLYKDKLLEIRQKQKSLIKLNRACTGATDWQVNGSTAQGKKMVSDMQKLLLRAFNTECDDIIAHVKVSNHAKALQRIHSICDSISKLGTIMKIAINQEYVNLKIEELNLALDYTQKKEAEKERLRELRAQEREEAKAQKEIIEARKRLQKEQMHYQNALKALDAQLQSDPNNSDLISKMMELRNGIAETEKAIADVDYREANHRAGYVYVISNIGAFGENVYKIGMTRRLDPMDRIHELGDASVPFAFDVHALIFTEDAPRLETALHNAFEDRKVNKINHRREFFRVSLDEIKSVVRENFDKTVEWTDIPEAEQYRQSLILK